MKVVLVKDIMIKNIITLKSEMNIFEAIEILIKNKISGAPVVDSKNKLIGILSEKDCLSLMIDDYENTGYGAIVQDFLTSNVFSITPDTDIFTAANLFYDNPFRRLPVVSSGKLVGQVSRRDVLVALVKLERSGNINKSKKVPKSKLKSVSKSKPESPDSSVLASKKAIQSAIKAVNAWPASNRPKDSKNKPGGLMVFPKSNSKKFIIVGDLHANCHNLETILKTHEEEFKQDEAILLLLGDVVHDDRPGHAVEMDDSIRIFEIIINTINRYPKNIIYLLGNHDTFSNKLTKRSVLQGKLFYEAVLEQRGEDYVKIMQKFFDSLPLIVKHPSFLAMHAGPIRGGATMKEMTNIRQNKDYLFQLTWNRINELHSTPNSKEYNNDDLIQMRKKMKSSDDAVIIVGHNPFWKWGNNDSVWENILNCKNHTILYSNLTTKCPYIVFENSKRYKVKYAELNTKEFTNMDYFSQAR